ncbi:serine hydrolase [Candidatus Kaiserbacteria bacterium]|nr:serine hydrolase [Candidatus Kaiserbacteria bacterium]
MSDEQLLLQEPIEEAEAPRHFPVSEQLGILAGILFLLLGTPQIAAFANLFIDEEESQEEEVANVEQSAAALASIFGDVRLGAQSAFVWDVKEQKALYIKNADERLPLASITKLMTALVAHEIMGTDAPITVTLEAISQEGDSGFRDGEQFSMQELLDLTLVTSSNDGAYSLAAAAGASVFTDQDSTVDAFVDAMNVRAREIGLTRTTFKNPTGLDLSETESGSYGSARDVSYLMEYLVQNYPEILERTTLSNHTVADSEGNIYQATNTNSTTRDIPGMVASKTGYTTLAGGNLTIAYDAGLNHPIVITVLGSSVDGRFEDVEKLVEATQTLLSNQ